MKLETPPGTRDFLPEEMLKRQELFDRIRLTFEKYGFSPAETPAFEYSEILEGKYGEEEKLIYRFEDMGGRKLALRYDLTVPLVRMFSSNQPTLPFKRYCISRVWRFDRPQKGRYREFWQCDVDTIGVSGMKADAEVAACAIDALNAIGLKNFEFRINNRKLLDGLLEKCGIPKEKELDAFRALDKLEKQGMEHVKKEFLERGVENGDRLLGMFSLKTLEEVEKEIGKNEGIDELRQILEYLKAMGLDKNVVLDLSMVRGLDYYTGPIFEVKEGDYGSIAGGGRYDNLIGDLSGKSSPAVGISLGIERIAEVMREKKLLTERKTATEVYVLCADSESFAKALEITKTVRSLGISAETDLLDRNFGNQMKYASKSNIPKVVIVGQRDLKQGNVTVKDMKTGEQKAVKVQDLTKTLKQNENRDT